jgi:hypothetical protein
VIPLEITRKDDDERGPRRYLERMKKIVLTFGLISGAILALMMAITIPLYNSGKLDLNNGAIIGYTTMVVASLLIFFGIRTFRENSGGTITFGKAFLTGLLITAVSGLVYVAAWEVIYFNFFPDFYEKCTAVTIEKMRTKGEPEAVIAAKQKEMNDFGVMYRNPLINAAFTFLEPLPVGLLMTLISAAILRKKAAQL